MFQMEFLATLNIQYDAIKVAEKSAVNFPSIHGGPWENSSEALKPCWNKPALKKGEQSKGLVTSTLANEPENHFSPQGVMPAYKKAKFLRAESSEFEEGIDFDICSQSLVLFAVQLFYGNVVRNRIAFGRSQVTVPAQINISSAPAGNYISPYISEKNYTFKKHPATSEAKYYAIKVTDEREVNLPIISGGQWKNDAEALKLARTSQHQATQEKNCHNAEEIGVFLRKIGFGMRHHRIFDSVQMAQQS